MKRLFNLVLIFFLFFGFSLYAQLENVVIEKYYISDVNDTLATGLKENSITYRIYIDMKPGCKLTKIYGNSEHELMFSSDSVFYNHTLEGQSFGRKFNVSRWSENTVALDSWITLGQTSLSKANGKTYFGTPKSLDRDASIIGGANSDEGMLSSNNPLAGIALTTNDGMDTMIGIPTTWLESGIEDDFGNDSTIFGSLKMGKKFSSYSAFITNSGVMGVNRDTNQVLIAQLTTAGEISFALNVEIIDKNGNVFQYVAKNGADSSSAGVYLAPFLNFPIPCGCTDPNYKEFNASFGCSKPGACLHEVVLGCMDMKACNFDPNASVNIASMCCYPGLCGDRDISVICPNLAINEWEKSFFELYPNPAENFITVKTNVTNLNFGDVFIYDAFGNLMLQQKLSSSQIIDITNLPAGIYVFQMSLQDNFGMKKFIKN